jgi:ABC-type nitrate/sulfonate/bicarbonate transport system permease component
MAFLALWQALTTLLRVDPQVLPGPRLILQSSWDARAALASAAWVTTQETVLGLGLALVVAAALGLAIDRSPAVRGGVYPLVIATQTLPIVAIAPLVVIWFGFGLAPKVVLVALFTFFPIVVGLVQGLAGAPPEVLDLLKTLRASRLQLLLFARLPAALPQLFTGFKIAVTYAFTSAIVAEFVGAFNGLGFMMTTWAHATPVRTDLVLGATALTAVLTIALFGAVAVLERLVMPWSERRSA